MENKYAKLNKISSIIAIALGLFGLVFSILYVILGDNKLLIILGLPVYLFALFYAIYGYKIPHSNFLKYILLLFSLYSCAQVFLIDFDDSVIEIIIRVLFVLVAITAAYFSGRLHRIEQNRVYITVSLVFLLVAGILTLITDAGEYTRHIPGFLGFVITFNMFILWLFISISYISRYYLHKMAPEKEEEKEEIKSEGFCPQCGTEYFTGDMFCEHCGTKLID